MHSFNSAQSARTHPHCNWLNVCLSVFFLEFLFLLQHGFIYFVCSSFARLYGIGKPKSQMLDLKKDKLENDEKA